MLQECLNWLLAPISGAEVHMLTPALLWHGRLMTLAWSFCVPIAVLAARYYKITPRQPWPQQTDKLSWWRTHRWCNYAAVGLSLVAIVLVSESGAHAGGFAPMHRMLGWALFALALLQLVGALERGKSGGPPRDQPAAPPEPGDHYDMTTRRVVFEYLHKLLGSAALLLAFAVTLLGLAAADAPRWMWLLLGGWWCLLVLLAVYLQRRGLCVDTYQALWGDAPDLPGLARRPIGWGVRRVPPGAGSPWRR